MNHPLKPLSNMQEVETIPILKQLAKSERALGELKGIAKQVPNESVLTNTLFIQEAKASSEIENIVTTQDDIYANHITKTPNPNVKEVENYKEALLKGYGIVAKQNLLTNNHIQDIQRIIKQDKAGYRKQMGTTLKDNRGNIIYTPPQNPKDIENLMTNLETFINDDTYSPLNPLVKLAIIHHQFESIHPFYDGNGRVGRIINVLYLSLKNLLDTPILYLSRHFIDHKQDYYTVLQSVREKNEWEPYILFVLRGIETTAKQTTKLIEEIITLMTTYKRHIRSNYPKLYSQDLINSLFKHPYTKIEFITEDLNIHRNTAYTYMDTLCKDDILQIKKAKKGKHNYYINTQLTQLLENIRDIDA